MKIKITDIQPPPPPPPPLAALLMPCRRCGEMMERGTRCRRCGAWCR